MPSEKLLTAHSHVQVARLGVPYALMHMRGEPATMQLPENMEYPQGVCKGVAEELARAAQGAMAAGIEPWRLILDPGESCRALCRCITNDVGSGVRF